MDPLTPVERFAAEVLERANHYLSDFILDKAVHHGLLCATDRQSPPTPLGHELLKRLKAAREDEEIASLRARLQTLESQRRTRA